MGWLIAGILALACFLVMALVLKLPRRTWEVSAAALILGLAGYALQGNPSMAGSPTAPKEKVAGAN